MDRVTEELQFLGFFGIFIEAYKLIASRGKLFFKIALSLILPLSLLLLANIQISNLLFAKISRNVLEMEFFPEGSTDRKRISSSIFSECSAFLLFKVIYLVGVIVFSLFSTSAIVYTVACAYAAKDASFRKVMKILPKVFKRLIVTFLCSFAILFVYNFTFFFPITMIIFFFAGKNSVAILIAIVLALFYLVGLIYIIIIWYLANVVSVLEDMYGLPALQKSKNLVRGKKWTIFAVLVVLHIPFSGIGLVLGTGQHMGVGLELVFAVVILVIMTLAFLAAFVVQTVVYFVCKSYHHESIDKSSLSDHLDVYSGEYLSLKQNDVQLVQCYV